MRNESADVDDLLRLKRTGHEPSYAHFCYQTSFAKKKVPTLSIEIMFVSFIFFANLVENCMYVFFAPSSNICLFFMIFLFLFRDWMTTMELEASLYHASDHNLIMSGIMSNGSKSLGTSSAAASSSPESEEGIVSREVSSAAGGNVSSRRRKVQNFVLLFFILSFFFTSFSMARDMSTVKTSIQDLLLFLLLLLLRLLFCYFSW